MQQYLIMVALVALARASVNRRVNIIADVDNNLLHNEDKIKAKSIYYRLNMTRSLRPLTLQSPGQPVELTCEVYGRPAPTVRWFRNHDPIYEHDIETNELISTNPTSVGRIKSTIIITNPRDKDVYTCVGSNFYYTKKLSTTVLTNGPTEQTERLKLYPLAPRILTVFRALFDIFGTTVVLPCKAKGHPRPKITWMVNNRVVKNDHRMKVLRSGELIISPLTWNDTGNIVCIAENIFGKATAETFLYAASGW